nr:polysaccharide deacetylase family protein [Ornithinimicrobium sediminis]
MLADRGEVAGRPSLSGRLTIIGASEEVIGFGLETLVNDGQEAHRSRETAWFDPREEKVLSWADLIAAEHREGLTEAVLSRLEEPLTGFDPDAAQELLEQGAALLGFTESGELLVGFEEGAVAPSYQGAPAVTFPQAHDDGWLTDLGQAAREATLVPLVGQVPTLEPTPSPTSTSEPEPTPTPTSEPQPTPEPTSEPSPTPSPTSEPDPTPDPVPSPSSGERGTWVVSAAAGANIRTGPGTDYPVVGGAAEGTTITGTMSRGWVYLDDGTGWISGATLTDPQSPTSTPDPEPTAPPGQGVNCAVDDCVALTFDDGPEPGPTERVLNTLAAYSVPATFFVIGSNVNTYPDLAARITAEGHQIGNHTMTHPSLPGLEQAAIRDELADANAAISAATGIQPWAMRPPYGATNATVRSIAADRGLTQVLWDVDTRDWEHKNPATTLATVQSQTTSGAIILMHDVHPTTADAVPAVIEWLHGQGYVLVTIDQLFATP